VGRESAAHPALGAKKAFSPDPVLNGSAGVTPAGIDLNCGAIRLLLLTMMRRSAG
jgi:hypothetical protein